MAGGGAARAVAAAVAVCAPVATRARRELRPRSGEMLPACRVLKGGVFSDATDEDNTSGGELSGELPLVRCVRVRPA